MNGLPEIDIDTEYSSYEGLSRVAMLAGVLFLEDTHEKG